MDGTRAGFDLTPQIGGDLPLTVFWDQQELDKPAPDCAACVTRISYGVTFARCRFRGRQPWLFRNGF